MNDNIDDWLNSLGLDTAASPSPSPTVPSVQPANVPQPSQEVVATQNSQPISPEDFNDILADNGFQEPDYDEAEEVEDESRQNEDSTAINLSYNPATGEYDENTGEGRDLDAEEDAEWDERIESGTITPIQNAFRVLEEAVALEAIQSVNENYPEHNPDEELSQEAVIPPNSPTLLLNDATSRFSGTEWYNEIQKARVILAGCGGIGSYVCYNLARMNIATLCLYDDDIVEQANMSGQFYCQEDVGKAKVDAMVDMCTNYTTMRNIYAIRERFTIDSEAGDIMICGFDNMAARRTFFTAWNNHVMSKPEEERAKCLYLDGRLSINCLQVFCITGDNDWAMAEYADKYLFTDEEAEHTQCSLKQTTYLACMIGSFIVNIFTNFIANSLNPIIPYDLPFFTEYDAQNMIFKTIK